MQCRARRREARGTARRFWLVMDYLGSLNQAGTIKRARLGGLSCCSQPRCRSVVWIDTCPRRGVGA